MGSLKGGEYERHLCRTISLWWSQDWSEPDDLVFWRSTQSGGMATTRAKKGKKANLHSADICAVNSLGEPLLKVLLLEAKRGYPRATLSQLMDKPDSKKKVEEDSYEEWIQKAERDRLRSGALYWAIIHKRDKRRALLLTPSEFVAQLPKKSVLSLSLGGPHAVLTLEDRRIAVMLLDDFLRAVTPKDILAMLENSIPTRGP